MASPATLVRNRVKAVFDAEFAAEGFVAAHDKLLRATGRDGAAHAAVSPSFEREDDRRANILRVEVVLQLYLGFQDSPSDPIVVDPSVIEGYGGRIRSAFRTQSGGTGQDFWYLRVTGIEYPDDPTGNKTRLEATILAFAENIAET